MAMSGNWWWSSVALYAPTSGDKNISLTDTFTGSDTVALITKEIWLSDPATFTDAISAIEIFIPIADTFTFGDLIVLITKEVWLDEQATFGEVVEVQGQIICDRFIDVLDGFATNEFLGFSVNIEEIATFGEFFSVLSGENKAIVIAESLHSTEVTPLNKRFTVQDQVSLAEFVSRILVLTDSFTAGDTLTRDKIFEILDGITLTDSVASSILIALQDSVTFSELLARIVECRESFSFNDLASLLRSQGLGESARMQERITITRSFDEEVEFEPPDDITKVIKDQYIKVENPAKIK